MLAPQKRNIVSGLKIRAKSLILKSQCQRRAASKSNASAVMKSSRPKRRRLGVVRGLRAAAARDRIIIARDRRDAARGDRFSGDLWKLERTFAYCGHGWLTRRPARIIPTLPEVAATLVCNVEQDASGNTAFWDRIRQQLIPRVCSV